MISIQKFFGKDDKFFTLLEGSADVARKSVQALNRILSNPGISPNLKEFYESKEEDKQITEQINEALVNAFVTQLEKEDIEVLSAALYRIPKTVEKFAERFAISSDLVKGTDFSQQIALLDSATGLLVGMVKMLRQLGSGRLDKVKTMNADLQRVEGDADKLILDTLGVLYSGKYEPIAALALRDLYELIERIIDRCRDAGNVITHIVLKNS
jgi:uncharacterized protein Yka (UPF0111/DUF47 family)